MQNIIIASASRGAGKTFVTVGLLKVLGKKAGYIKPLGNRLIYSRKTLKDYDAALITKAFGIKTPPEDLTIGFEHAKIRYTYDRSRVKEKVLGIVNRESKGKKVLVIEGGSDLAHGKSVNLDAVSLARYTGGKILLVVNGDSFDALDQTLFCAEYIRKSGAAFAGVVINSVRDEVDCSQTIIPEMERESIRVLGVLPHSQELSYYTAGYLADNIFSKNLTGEAGLDRVVKNVFVGDMSASSAVKNYYFRREGNVIITSGDRSDMILAAIENNASAIVLTNNIMPHAKIISAASNAKVPLLLVPTDTYATATTIEHMEHLLTANDTGKIRLLGSLIKKNLRIKELCRI